MQTTQEPPKIEPKRLGDYLEQMSMSVLQTGISWRVVQAKWPGFGRRSETLTPKPSPA